MLKWLKSNCFAEEIPWKTTTTTIWLAEVRERGHNHSRLVIPHAFWILIIAKWLNRNISSLSSSSLYNFLCSIHYIIRWVFVCVSTASTRRQPDHHIPKQRKKKSERCERKIIVLQLLAQNGFTYVSLRLRLEPIFLILIHSTTIIAPKLIDHLSCTNCMRWVCDSFMSSRPFETKWMT